MYTIANLRAMSDAEVAKLISNYSDNRDGAGPDIDYLLIPVYDVDAPRVTGFYADRERMWTMARADEDVISARNLVAKLRKWLDAPEAMPLVPVGVVNASGYNLYGIPEDADNRRYLDFGSVDEWRDAVLEAAPRAVSYACRRGDIALDPPKNPMREDDDECYGAASYASDDQTVTESVHSLCWQFEYLQTQRAATVAMAHIGIDALRAMADTIADAETRMAALGYAAKENDTIFNKVTMSVETAYGTVRLGIA